MYSKRVISRGSTDSIAKVVSKKEDEMEPWMLEEARQRRLAQRKWPECEVCGRDIGGFENCLVLGAKIYCPRCVRLHTVYTENLEVIL